VLKDAVIILRKELKNIFKDTRTVVSNFVLPLFLMPIFFLTIAFFGSQQQQAAQETVYEVAIVNAPNGQFQEILSRFISFETSEEARARDVLTVEFPQGYSVGEPAEVELYFDSTSNESRFAASQIEQALSVYEDRQAADILDEVGLSLSDLDRIQVQRVDVAPEEAQGADFLATMLPYVILIYIFAGAMGIGMDTSAGEKERGSLPIVLVNQVSRSSIAAGKVGFVVISGLLNSLSSFAGIILAVIISGRLFPDANFMAGGIGAFGLGGVIALLLTLLTASAMAASIIVFLGSMAKNMKEASGYIVPVYLLVILVGVATIGMDAAGNIGLFLIPFVNVVFMLKGVILSQFGALQLLFTVLANLAAAGIVIVATARLYNSERILNSAS
jgi:sodium transport system permease protein